MVNRTTKKNNRKKKIESSSFVTLEPWYSDCRTNVFVGLQRSSSLSAAQHFKYMLSRRITGWMEINTYGQEKLIAPFLDSYNLCSEGTGAEHASFSHTTCHTRPVTLKGVSLWKDKRPRALRTGSSGRVLWPARRRWEVRYVCCCVIFRLLLETAPSLCGCRDGLISI